MVKRLSFVLIALLLLVPAECFSQKVKKVRPPKDPEWVLHVTPEGKLHRDPTFKLRNPKNSFNDWIADNLKMPKGFHPGFNGTTVVNFYIEPDGRILQIDILKSSGSFELDKAAVDVIAKSPDWEPATVDGEPVPYKYAFPITFRVPVVAPNSKFNNR